MAEALEGYDAIEGAGVTVRATDALMFCKTRKASEFRAVWSMETEAGAAAPRYLCDIGFLKQPSAR